MKVAPPTGQAKFKLVSEMGRLVFLLAFAVFLPSITATVVACNSPAPPGQDFEPRNGTASPQGAAAGESQAEVPPSTKATSTLREVNATAPNTANPLPTTTPNSPEEATATVSNAAEPAPTSTPAPTDDDGLEFESADPGVSSARDGGITAEGQGPSKESGPPVGPVQGRSYAWEDGDRTLTVYLQTDLAVEESSDGLPRDIVATDGGGASVVRSEGGQSQDDVLPVFRSESGELMTLPGGVLLVLNSEWGEAETDAFFSTNSIKTDRVSELSYVANGFFIETEPGFPSLDLANALAVLDGVEVSSPNWSRERSPK